MRADERLAQGAVPALAIRSRRDLLRDATAREHGLLDAQVAAWLDAPLANYPTFLAAHFAALSRIEPALQLAGAAAVLSDWTQRRKLPLLLADLEALGLAPPPTGQTGPHLCGPAGALGALYVVEGATLGGAVLDRRVRARFPQAAGATRYLASYGAARGDMWRRFLTVLEASEAARNEEGHLVEGAHAAFACFVEAFSGLRHAAPAAEASTIGMI